MPKPASRAETIKVNTIKDMKALGIYKKEYDRIIAVYSDIFERYIALNKQANDVTFAVRSELAISIENARKDILTYASTLGITPAGLRKISGDNVAQQKKSKLSDALDRLG